LDPRGPVPKRCLRLYHAVSAPGVGQTTNARMAHMIEMFRVQQETLLRGALTGLLAQISQDYNLDNAELLNRYLTPTEQSQIKNGDSVPAPILVMAQQEKTRKNTQKTKPSKVCCKGTTAKGQPCKFAALADGFCKKHSAINSKDPTPRTQKTKQEKPRHTHLTEEDPEETCQVCEQQGDVTNPEMPRQDWEIQGADEIKARLTRMLAEVEEPEEPEENPEIAPVEELLGEETLEELEENPEIAPVEELLGEETLEEPEDDLEDDLEARLKKILSEESDDECDA